jgi:hypothetical protein
MVYGLQIYFHDMSATTGLKMMLKLQIIPNHDEKIDETLVNHARPPHPMIGHAQGRNIDIGKHTHLPGVDAQWFRSFCCSGVGRQ